MAKFLNIRSSIILILILANKLYALSVPDTIKTNTLKFINIYFDTISISKPTITIDKNLFKQMKNKNNINLTGWKSFEINSNPNSINAINQSLYLKFEGKISNKYKINGYIKDYNNPYDEFDEVKKLNNLEQIYFEIIGPAFSIKGGNFFINNDNIKNKIFGLSTSYKEYSITTGIIQTKFATYSFYGKDGINGPYFVTSNTIGSYILIVKNSEKIYKNNRLLKKGSDKDYIIDYITGAIYFNPDSLINSNDRFYIEFMYSQNSYKRYLLNSNMKINKYISIQFNKISDISESPESFDLTDEIKNKFKKSNKNDTIITLSGIQESNSGNYILKNNHYEYIGNNKGNFILSFYYIGKGKGDYSYVGNGIYKYTPSAGDYNIGNIIPTPKTTDYINLSLQNHKNINIKLSISKFTPNKFINYSKNGIKYNISYKFKNLQFISYYKDNNYSSLLPIFNNEKKRILLIPDNIFLKSILTNSMELKHKKGSLKLNQSTINNKYKTFNINNSFNIEILRMLQNFSITKNNKIFVNNKFNIAFNNLKFAFYNEYKSDTLSANDSSYIFNNLKISLKNFSINLGNENFYNNSSLNNNYFSINNNRTFSKLNIKSNIALSYKMKRWNISKKIQNFYILSYKVKYNQKNINININHFNNMQESFKFARKFIRISDGMGNYSFDSTLNGYVPDKHGNYILKKEIIKNTEPITKTKNDINLSYKHNNLLQFIYSLTNELQIKSNKPNIKYFLSFPFKYNKELINSKETNNNFLTILSLKKYKISYNLKQSNRFIGIYTNYFSEKKTLSNSIKLSKKNTNLVIGILNNRQNENNLSNIKYTQKFIFVEYKKGIIATKSGLKHYYQENNYITNFFIQSNIDYKFSNTNFLNIFLKINIIQTDLQYINYFILYGKQKGTNFEININLKKNIFQNNTINFNFYLRKYSNEKFDQNFSINIHSYF